MAADLSDRVKEIAREREIPESAVLEAAIERGVQGLWEDIVLGQYLDGSLTRETAVERVGREKVRRAEREREIVEEDVEWGLNA
ncbi:MAG: hypothetical protein IH933_00915 [Euryarchaeota archaeon]|jgi:predicted transcriptional regulator|nr:hypothetical protein [Euryarchaeota archaeon]